MNNIVLKKTLCGLVIGALGLSNITLEACPDHSDKTNKRVELKNHQCALNYYNIALVWFEQQKYAEAIIVLETAAQCDSTESRIFEKMGMSYFYLEDYEQALAYLTQAINLNPQNGSYYSERSLVFNSMNNELCMINDLLLGAYLGDANCQKSLEHLGIQSKQITNEKTLTEQFNSGILQQRIKRKQIDPNTLIHTAILESNPVVVSFLLNHGVDVDYLDEHGMTPLTVALLNNNPRIVEELLKHGANPNAETKWNDMSLLELSLLLNDKASTILLLAAGADPDCTLHGEWAMFSPLTVVMIYKKDMELAQSLVKAGANLNEPVGRKNALYMCYSYSHIPIKFKKFLIEQGANVNAESENGIALLWDVICNKNLEFAKILIQAGADLNHHGYLSHCIGNKFPYEFICFLIENGACVNGDPTSVLPLSCAIYNENMQQVRCLIEAGADVNYHHQNGETALLTAIRTGNIEIIQLLLESGVDVNLTVEVDKKTRSPLKEAIRLNKPEIARCLLQNGARA